METQAQHFRQTHLATLLARPWVTRLLATIGIVLTLVGLYTPFAGKDIVMHAYNAARFSQTWTLQGTAFDILRVIHRGPFSLTLALVMWAIFSVVALGGLALIPLLWRRLSATSATRTRWLYGTWLLLMAALAVLGLLVWHYFMSLAIQDPLAQLDDAGPLYIMPGAIIFPLGLLVNCIALPFLRWEPLPTSHLAPRTGWQWASAFTLTAGAIVWVVGFYLMPEAITAACPSITFSVTQFAHGACAGLDSDQVLSNATYAHLNPIAALLYVVGRHFDLLVAIGGITMLGGWTRQLSAQTLAWLAAWPALAFGVALVALQGVGQLAQSGFRLSYASGSNWHVAAGLVVTFAGIGLVALGQIGLWREIVRRKRAA